MTLNIQTVKTYSKLFKKYLLTTNHFYSSNRPTTLLFCIHLREEKNWLNTDNAQKMGGGPRLGNKSFLYHYRKAFVNVR